MPTDNFIAAGLRDDDETTAVKAPPPVVSNPFGVVKAPTGSAAESDVARAVTEVQAAMLIARKFPRDERAAVDKILNAFARPGLAEKAVYQYARGGSDIFGPSIRAAETIAQCWGNIYTGVRELEQRNGVSTVEAFAWDTESGFHDVKVFQVKHERYTKKGSYKIDDPRDIYEHVANAAARRKRACILAVIPSDVVESAMQQADVTLKTKIEITPERIAKMLEGFGAFGVSKEAIEKRIQRHADAITAAQMVNLGRIYNSIRDGMSKPEEWFEADGNGAPTEPANTGAVDAAKEALRKRTSKASTGPGPTGPSGSTGVGPIGAKPTGEPGPVGPLGADLMPPPELPDVLKAIKAADNHDALDIVLDAARPVAAGSEQAAAEIDVASRAKRKALGDR